jgi:hypothetical protein
MYCWTTFLDYNNQGKLLKKCNAMGKMHPETDVATLLRTVFMHAVQCIFEELSLTATTKVSSSKDRNVMSKIHPETDTATLLWFSSQTAWLFF